MRKGSPGKNVADQVSYYLTVTLRTVVPLDVFISRRLAQPLRLSKVLIPQVSSGCIVYLTRVESFLRLSKERA